MVCLVCGMGQQELTIQVHPEVIRVLTNYQLIALSFFSSVWARLAIAAIVTQSWCGLWFIQIKNGTFFDCRVAKNRLNQKCYNSLVMLLFSLEMEMSECLKTVVRVLNFLIWVVLLEVLSRIFTEHLNIFLMFYGHLQCLKSIIAILWHLHFSDN